MSEPVTKAVSSSLGSLSSWQKRSFRVGILVHSLLSFFRSKNPVQVDSNSISSVFRSFVRSFVIFLSVSLFAYAAI